MTGNPIDLDALREALARGLHDHDCGDPWEDVLGPDDEQHRRDYYERADAALAVVAPLIAELRQHREAQQEIARFADALDQEARTKSREAFELGLGQNALAATKRGIVGANLEIARKIRAIFANVQRGPVPPEETP